MCRSASRHSPKVSIPTSNGRWTVSLNGTYFSKYDVQNPDGTFSGGIDQVNSATGGVVLLVLRLGHAHVRAHNDGDRGQ